MNALEHIFFVLDSAIENNQIKRGELRDALTQVRNALIDGEALTHSKLERISVRLGRRYPVNPTENLSEED